jgi:rubredoxin
MVKMKRKVPAEPMPAPVGRFVCLGCGYEYIPELGDEDGEVAPGTKFKDLAEEWTCPDCGEEKVNFIPSSIEV